MAKKTEQKTESRTFTSELKCDLCGRLADVPDYGHWGQYPDLDTTTVEYRDSTGDYESGSYGTTHSFDICPECFTTKLKPWLEQQGAECSEVEFG